jgi:hypothetical protein
VIIILIFIISFLSSRKLLFKDRTLEAVFDKTNNTATICRTGLLKKKIETLLFDSIKSVEVGSKKFVPQNIDGIKFVERISLQHASYKPGLADVEEFVTLTLKLLDGSERILYAGRIEDEPELPLDDIRRFLRK